MALGRLRSDLARLAQKPAFRFDDPIDEAIVAAAEAKLGITFPPEYREFVTTLSAGRNESGTFTRSVALAERAGGAIARPFPVSDTAASEALRNRSPIDASYPPDGIFLIWDHGGGEETFLVISGEQRGMMWRGTEEGFIPEHEMNAPHAVQFSFVPWLEWWLTVW